MIQNATIRVLLFRSKTLAHGEHPLMLVITKNGKRKYQALGLSCHPDKWDEKRNEPKRSHPEKLTMDAIIRQTIAEVHAQAMDMRMHDKEFSSETLLTAVSKPKVKSDVFAFFEEIIQRLIAQKKIGNANAYRDAMRTLKAFLPKSKTLPFTDVDLTSSTALKPIYAARICWTLR